MECIRIVTHTIWKSILRLFSSQVVYGDNPSDAPTENRVQEINKQNDVESDDLNKGFQIELAATIAISRPAIVIVAASSIENSFLNYST